MLFILRIGGMFCTGFFQARIGVDHFQYGDVFEAVVELLRGVLGFDRFRFGCELRLQHLQSLIIGCLSSGIKEHPDDLINCIWICNYKLTYCMHGDRCSLLQRIGIDPRRNRRKSNTANAVLLCHLQRISIAIRKKLCFIVASAAPDRSHSMDHIFARQLVCISDLRFSGLAPMQFAAFCEQFLACSAMNGAVDSTATEKRFVCGVYDCDHRGDLCDVALGCADEGGSLGHGGSFLNKRSTRHSYTRYFFFHM